MHYMKERLQKEAEAIIVRNSITKHSKKKKKNHNNFTVHLNTKKKKKNSLN